MPISDWNVFFTNLNEQIDFIKREMHGFPNVDLERIYLRLQEVKELAENCV